MKTKKITEARVVVDLDMHPTYLPSQRYSEDRLRRDGDLLMADIRRHIDCPNRPYFQLETVDVCSLCGREWDECEGCDDGEECPKGLPQCCLEAQREWRDERKVEA